MESTPKNILKGIYEDFFIEKDILVRRIGFYIHNQFVVVTNNIISEADYLLILYPGNLSSIGKIGVFRNHLGGKLIFTGQWDGNTVISDDEDESDVQIYHVQAVMDLLKKLSSDENNE